MFRHQTAHPGSSGRFTAALTREIPDLPATGDPASAILWNQSEKPICAFTLIWKYDWKDEEFNNRTRSSTRIHGVGHAPSLLLPFGLNEDRRAFEAYWQTILPHSRRYVDGSHRVLGSNADVRPPSPDEQWIGGVMRWGGEQRQRHDSVDQITLTLDAAFFSTGECAGPDTKQLWERFTVAAELYRELAAAAVRSVEAGFNAEQVLAEVERITGEAGDAPPPPPPPTGG